jgi:enamine deaminase RidA (YjgF/YER057c/UK114 family)
MAVRYRNVEGLIEPPGYSHLAVGAGERVIFTAGQVPLDGEGNLVGPGDHEAQAEQVLANLLATLEAAGVTPAHVLKTTVYVVGRQEDLPAVWEVVRRSPVGRAPSTLLGVERLGYTGQLVEIEAVAID